MESELMNLQQRVAELEAALATVTAQHRPSRHRWRVMLVGMFCAGVVAISLVVNFATGASATTTQQGPSKVVAPFEVVDGRGRTLFRLQMSASGAGIGVFFDDTGEECAVIGHSSGEGKPTIQVLNKGILKAGMGIGGGGNGLVVVGGAGEPAVTLVGKEGGVYTSNAAGQTVTMLGVDTNGQGYVLLKRPGGGDGVSMTVSPAGFGMVQVWKPDEVGVIIGSKGQKGDVCANGEKGTVCLSQLAAKNLMPY